MDLTKFKFPSKNETDTVFSVHDTIPELLEEARSRGFYNNFNNPYNKLFSELFFNGGSVVFKKGIDEKYRDDVWNYVRAYMRSFAPKHEHKEAVCAMLMSEILKPNLKK